METKDNRGSDTEPNYPPGIESKGDKYLFTEIQKVGTSVNEVVRAVEALPANVDAKIEPLNSRLATVGQAIESLSKLSTDVEKIREEFTGFRDFRQRIETREKFVEDSIKGVSKRVFYESLGFIVALAVSTFGVIGTVAIYGFHLGSAITGINDSVVQANKSVGDMKGSIDKLETASYQLNATLSGQVERLNAQIERPKGTDEQIKAIQVAVREAPAKTAAETSEKAAERIAGALKPFEDRIVKGYADQAEKLASLARKVEETSDVLVVRLDLDPETKPSERSDTTLTFNLPVPLQQNPRMRQAFRSKASLAGVVSFYLGDDILMPGIAAMARPMDDRGRIPIQLFFHDKAAVGDFEQLMGRLREDHKRIRLKVTFTLG